MLNKYYYLFIILLLISFSQGQTCCGNLTCPNHGYCICDPTNSIDYCANQLTETPGNFIINDTTSYYYFSPTVSSYQSMEIVFCGSQNQSASNILSYIVQDTNGGQYPNATNSQSYPFSATSQCQIYLMPTMNFRMKSNNQRQNIIFSLRLNVSGYNQNMSINIIVQTNIDAVLVPILIGIIGVLGVVAISLIIFYIRRRFLQKKKQIELQKNKFEHFQKYMPIKKLADLSFTEDNLNCAVCLNDILKEETIRKTPCDHIFHLNCIDDWCKKNMNCPICRESFQLKDLMEKFKKSTQTKQRVWQMSKLDANLLEQSQRDEIQQPTQTQQDRVYDNNNLQEIHNN